MKKTQTAKRRKPSAGMLSEYKSDEMRQEYKFDYRKAKPNRFASRISRRDMVVVFHPDVLPAQHLLFVAPAREVIDNPEASRVSNRVRGLKDLIYTLLKEVQALEHDELLADSTTPQEIHKLDIKQGVKFDDIVREFETNIIKQALIITSGNQARAARMLGIKLSTLNYKIKLYNIS